MTLRHLETFCFVL